jgi:hypothetical protein
MLCSNCGQVGAGTFCPGCGRRLAPPDVLPADDWSHEVRYAVLLHFPEVRARIARSGDGVRKKMTGEDWLGLYDAVMKPFNGGVSLKTVAAIVAPLYARIGIKTGKSRSEVYRSPPGRVIVDVLCALARNGLPLTEVHQAADGCVLEAGLPSDLWSFAGQVIVTVNRAGPVTTVKAATTIPGTWFDWGKSGRCLDRLFGALERPAA